MLFSTIELIFDGNTELLESLKAELEKDVPMLGSVFLRMVDQICQYYGVFCNHQKEAMDTIERCESTSPAFKSFLEGCLQRPEVGGLSLLAFLVKPFQRLLKYPLLLTELLKNTPMEHPDRQNIDNALKKLQEEVNVINTNKFKSDNMKKMLDISQSVEELPRRFKLLLPSRYFAYEGTLMKISGKHDQERHFFLFNDLLMYTKKKSNSKFLCRGIIYLNKLQVENVNDPLSFKVFRSDKNLTYILYGKSTQEKEVWLNQIGKQQNKLNPESNKKVEVKPGEKREILRVYVSKETFKSLAAMTSTTARDLCDEAARKVQVEGFDSTKNYKICVVVAGKERMLEDTERPLEVQSQLLKQGVKFGNEINHFKLIVVPIGQSSGAGNSPRNTVPPSSSPEIVDRSAFNSLPNRSVASPPPSRPPPRQSLASFAPTESSPISPRHNVVSPPPSRPPPSQSVASPPPVRPPPRQSMASFGANEPPQSQGVVSPPPTRPPPRQSMASVGSNESPAPVQPQGVPPSRAPPPRQSMAPPRRAPPGAPSRRGPLPRPPGQAPPQRQSMAPSGRPPLPGRPQAPPTFYKASPGHATSTGMARPPAPVQQARASANTLRTPQQQQQVNGGFGGSATMRPNTGQQPIPGRPPPTPTRRPPSHPLPPRPTQ